MRSGGRYEQGFTKMNDYQKFTKRSFKLTCLPISCIFKIEFKFKKNFNKERWIIFPLVTHILLAKFL